MRGSLLGNEREYHGLGKPDDAERLKSGIFAARHIGRVGGAGEFIQLLAAAARARMGKTEKCKTRWGI